MEQEHIEAFLAEVRKHLPNIDNKNMKLAMRAARELFEYQKIIDQFPKSSEVKKQLGKSTKAGESCLAAFNSLHSGVYEKIDEMVSGVDFNLNDFLGLDFVHILECVDELRGNFLIPGQRGGPREDRSLNQFIRVMARVYELTTGQPAKGGVKTNHLHDAFHGGFFDLVWACLEAAERKPHSETALGFRMTTVLKNRARTFN